MYTINRQPVEGAFGTSFDQAMQQITQLKMQDLLQRHQDQKGAKVFQDLNFTPQEAAFLNATPPKDRPNAMYALNMLKQQQAPQQQGPSQLNQALQQPQQGMEPPSTGQVPLQQLLLGQAYGQPQQKNASAWPRQPEAAQQMQQVLPQQNQQAMPQIPKKNSFSDAIGSMGSMAKGFDKKNSNDYFKMQNLQLKQEKAIYDTQKGFLKKISAQYDNDYEMKSKAQEALELLSSGKTRSGYAGMLPLGLTQANAETRRLDKIYAELAGKVAQQGGGVMSRARIQLAQAQKPSLDMPIAAQKALLQRMIEQAEKGGLAVSEISDALIQQNGGKIPENLEQKVRAIYKQYYDSDNQQQMGKENQVTGKPQEFNPEDENLLSYGLRQGIRGAARVGGAVAGSLGDVAGAGLGLLNYATGGKTPTYSDVQNKVPMLKNIPTSDQIAEKLGEWTKGYTNPQSSFESLSDDILGTFGAIFAPSRVVTKVASTLGKVGMSAGAAQKAAKIALPFSGVNVGWKRALGMTAAGEGAKNVVEASGGGPVAQTIAKLAFMTAAGTAGTRGAFKQQESQLYNDSKEAFKNDKTDVRKALNRVEKLREYQIKTAKGNDTEILPVIDRVIAGLKQSKNGLKPVNELIDLKANQNELFGKSLVPRMPGDTDYLSKAARKPLRDMIDILNNSISEAGLKNPTGGKLYAQAMDYTKGLNYSGAVSKWIKDIGKHEHSFLPHSVPGMAVRLMQGAAKFTVGQVSQLTDILHMPEARKAYMAALDAAYKQDKQAFVKNLALLDKIGKKKEAE